MRLRESRCPSTATVGQIREWLYVGDHCSAIRRVLDAGATGETYNVGGWNEKTNLEVVQTLCALLDELRPVASGKSYAEQIAYVTDRPGHDGRYAIDAGRIARELDWRPEQTFATRRASHRPVVPGPSRVGCQRDQRRLPRLDRSALRRRGR